MSDTVPQSLSFGPDRVLDALKLNSASPQIQQTIRILWNIMLMDDEGWDKSSQNDRADIEECMINNIAPILQTLESFQHSFIRAPGGVKNFDDVTIAAIAQHFIYNEAFNHEDASLVQAYYETAKICNEDNDEDESPHRFPQARKIYADVSQIFDGTMMPDDATPEAHYLYLVSDLTDHQDILSYLQDPDIGYDDKREAIDKMTRVNPAFLIECDSLSEAVITGENLLLSMRPAKAALTLVPAP